MTTIGVALTPSGEISGSGRRPFRPLLMDQAGNAILGGEVVAYTVGTTNEVGLWSEAVGGVPVAQPLITNEQGVAFAWVEDELLDVKFTDNAGTAVTAVTGHRATFTPTTILDSAGPAGPPGPSVDTVETANTGAGYVIDPDDATLFVLTVDADTALSILPAGNGRSIVVRLIQTGVFTVTWDVAVAWPANIPHVMTPIAGRTDVVVFQSDGATWLGMIAGQSII